MRACMQKGVYCRWSVLLGLNDVPEILALLDQRLARGAQAGQAQAGLAQAAGSS